MHFKAELRLYKEVCLAITIMNLQCNIITQHEAIAMADIVVGQVKMMVSPAI